MAQNTETIERDYVKPAEAAPQFDKQHAPLPASDSDLHQKRFSVHNPRIRMAAKRGGR